MQGGLFCIFEIFVIFYIKDLQWNKNYVIINIIG